MRWLYDYLAADAVTARYCPRCQRTAWHFVAAKTCRVFDVCCRCDRVQSDGAVTGAPGAR
jgi:Holliday junction resolvase-like predicted endonuclease